MAQLKTFALSKRQAKLNSFKRGSDLDDGLLLKGWTSAMESNDLHDRLTVLRPQRAPLRAGWAPIIALRIIDYKNIKHRIEEFSICNEGQLTEADLEYDWLRRRAA